MGSGQIYNLENIYYLQIGYLPGESNVPLAPFRYSADHENARNHPYDERYQEYYTIGLKDMGEFSGVPLTIVLGKLDLFEEAALIPHLMGIKFPDSLVKNIKKYAIGKAARNIKRYLI